MQEQDQAGAWLQMRRCRASPGQTPGVGEELFRERRAMLWRRSGHEAAPMATVPFLFGDDALTIGGFPMSGNPTRICEMDH